MPRRTGLATREGPSAAADPTSPVQRPTRRDRWAFAGSALAGLGIATFAVARSAGWAADDFYITYRYAENLARGRGFVYNPGERVFGLTDPGLGLLLAAFRRLTHLPVEWLASAVYGAALVGVALLLLADGRSRGRGLERAAGGVLLLVSSLTWANNGAAAPLALALLLLAARLAERHLVAAGLLAGLAVWVRPDAASGVALLGLLLVLERRRLPWRFAVAAGAVIALGCVFAWSYFGAVLPNTLQAKAEMAGAAAGSASYGRFWPAAAVTFSRHFGSGWPLLVGLGLLGSWPLYRSSGRAGRLFVLHSAALAIAYPLLGVPLFLWYILLPVFALGYGVPALVGALVRRAVSASGSSPRAVLPGAVAGSLLFLLATRGLLSTGIERFRTFEPPPRLVAYRQAAEWIRSSSRPGDSVAYVEIGVLGFYSERPIEDLMGLVTPRVLPYVRRGDLLGGFLTRPAKLVLFHPRGRMGPIVRAPWFARAYREVARFTDSGFRGGALVIFRRRPGARVPPPASRP